MDEYDFGSRDAVERVLTGSVRWLRRWADRGNLQTGYCESAAWM